MNTMDVSIGSGKVILPDSTTTMTVFHVTAPFNHVFAGTSGIRRGFGSATNVNNLGTLHGTIYGNDVGFPPGSVLMVTSSRKIRGVSVSDGAILLRLRPGAAMLNVTAKLPGARENQYGQRLCMFMGHADILSVEEAAILGIMVPTRYRDKFFVAEELEERFEVSELLSEMTPRPEYVVVSTPTGIQTREVAAPIPRRIKIRK